MQSSTLSPASALEQLERVLASETFRSAGRSSRLLRFLVEHALNGQADRLKEYTIGAEALQRGETFDPRIDSIARVEVSRLRNRLERYYSIEGRTDAVTIFLPKGSYVPLFEARTDAAASERSDHGAFDDLFAKAVVHHTAAASGIKVPSRSVALAADTGIERWAPARAAEIDIQVLEWLGRQMRSNRRPNTTLMALIATLVGAAAVPLAQTLPGMADLGM